MKRLWIGLVILSTVLGSSGLIRKGLETIHSPIAEDLNTAAAAALTDDWDTALDKAEHAYVRWNTFHRFTAAFTDHTPMEELDGLFEELKIYARQRDNPHFSATCKRLRFLVFSIPEAHRLSWWNLLQHPGTG